METNRRNQTQHDNRRQRAPMVRWLLPVTMGLAASMSWLPSGCSDDSGGSGSADAALDAATDASGCSPGETRTCGSDEGACRQGTQQCQDDGQWGACEGGVEPADELCNGIDDDCNGQTDETFLDLGRDCGQGACAGGVMECTEDGLSTTCSTMPGGSADASGPESCNGIDDDCDGDTDEDASDMSTWFRDEDEDGYGTSDATALACDRPQGYVANAADCDDRDFAVHPLAGDQPGDGLDSDCDGNDCLAVREADVYFALCPGNLRWAEARQACQVAGLQDLASIRTPEEQTIVGTLVAEMGSNAWIGYTDEAQEGTWVWSDTSDATYENWGGGEPNNAGGNENCAVIYASGPWNDTGCDNTGAAGAYLCELRQGAVQDADGDGVTESAGDCDDLDPATYPGAPELCDGRDNDCDGQTDEEEDAVSPKHWYRDLDGDGYGDTNDATQACARPDGYVANDGDCDDQDPDVHPYAGDAGPGDGIDEDCDGLDCIAGFVQGAYFVLCTEDMTWAQANTTCINAGYDGLASLRNAREQAVVLSMLDAVNAHGAVQRPWIGATDQGHEGDWIWVDGASWGYENWASGEPNNYGGNENCGALWESGVWNDYPCDHVDGATAWVCSAHPKIGEDHDGDGVTVEQGDCNDFNASVHPGATEVVGDGLDHDCQNDADGDGWDSTASGGLDCDDSNPQVNPAAPEVCNGVDDNCRQGETDALDAVDLYRDADGDGYGNPSLSVHDCEGFHPGYVADNQDCYDGNSNAHPGQDNSYTSDRGDGSFDYDCDGAETPAITASYGCTSWFSLTDHECLCSSGSGWVGDVPACGETDDYVDAASHPCVAHAQCLGGCCTCDSPTTISVTQPCH